jgi:hypothetical protein
MFFSTKIFSTILYGDDRYKHKIYIAAHNLWLARYYFWSNLDIKEIKESYSRVCSYPIQLEELSLFDLNLSITEEQYFKTTDSNIIIFIETPI